jgi:hypothetical protein
MENTLAGQFTVSDTGALVYVTGGALPGAERLLAWVDRTGHGQTLEAPPRSYSKPRLSPDGRYISVSTQQDVRDVWRYDIARGALNPITIDGQSGYGLFAPDGKRVVFRSGAAGVKTTCIRRLPTEAGAERLTTSTRSQTPASWSPDGTTLAYVEEGPSSGFFQFDIWGLSMADRKLGRSCRRPPTKCRLSFRRTATGWLTSRMNPACNESLRAALSRPRRASPDFKQRRRAARVARRWARTVLCATRLRQPGANFSLSASARPSNSKREVHTRCSNTPIPGHPRDEAMTFRRMDSVF